MPTLKFTITDTLHTILEKEAAKLHGTTTQVVRMAIDYYISNDFGRKAAIAAPVANARPVGRPAKEPEPVLTREQQRLRELDWEEAQASAWEKEMLAGPADMPEWAAQSNLSTIRRWREERNSEKAALLAGMQLPPLKPIEECTTRKELLDHPDYDALEEAEQDILYNRLAH